MGIKKLFLFSNRHATAATLRHLCALFMHIAQSLNLIIIMLNQGSSCENSLSYLVASRPQLLFN